MNSEQAKKEYQKLQNKVGYRGKQTVPGDLISAMNGVKVERPNKPRPVVQQVKITNLNKTLDPKTKEGLGRLGLI